MMSIMFQSKRETGNGATKLLKSQKKQAPTSRDQIDKKYYDREVMVHKEEEEGVKGSNAAYKESDLFSPINIH